MRRRAAWCALLVTAGLVGCARPAAPAEESSPAPGAEPASGEPTLAPEVTPADLATEPAAEPVAEPDIAPVPLSEITDPGQRLLETARRALLTGRSQLAELQYALAAESFDVARAALRDAAEKGAECPAAIAQLAKENPGLPADVDPLIAEIEQVRGPLAQPVASGPVAPGQPAAGEPAEDLAEPQDAAPATSPTVPR